MPLIQKVPTPQSHDCAIDKGYTMSLKVDTSPLTVGGKTLFFIPYNPNGGFARAYKDARKLIEGAT
jgi:hypothetical protein